MISVVCVVNDKEIFENNLLASLHEQTADYELLVIDNIEGQFSSIPEAINSAASKARHEYILCAHQDVYLIGKSWLKRAEEACTALGNMGVSGVAGVNKTGGYVGFIVDRGRFWGNPLEAPAVAFTLDECLLLMHKDTFLKNKFDESFKFHSYGADMCLRVSEQGLYIYVIPCPIYHNSATIPILRAWNIGEDDSKLYLKHRNAFLTIYKTTGKATPYSKHTPSKIRGSVKLLSYRQILRIFYVDERILAEFPSKSSLLDVGVIPLEQSWIKHAKKESYSVGVSAKKQYLLASKRINIHNEYVLASPCYMPFQKGAFAIILIKGLLEYSKKEEGTRAINNALQVGREKLVIIAPNNGYALDTAYQCYLSKWNSQEFKKMGFKTSGLYLRVDIQQKVKVLKTLPFLKPILARFCPNHLSRDVLCVKHLT